MTLVAVTADFIAPYPDQGRLGLPSDDILHPPSFKHPFGTTNLGRDILSATIFGGRISLLLAVEIALIILAVGVTIGLIAGFYGGIVDELAMRVTDVFLGFPSILLSLLIVATIGGGYNAVVIALGTTWWTWHARLARSAALTLKNQPFVLASRSWGANSFKVLVRHILPNAMPPQITLMAQDFGAIILAASGLSFLGLGIQEPTPDWGLLIASSRAYFPINWWFATFPGLALFITVLGFTLLGEGLRDYLDPKLRRIIVLR
jgi:peptide/nickel transport system permease protein